MRSDILVKIVVVYMIISGFINLGLADDVSQLQWVEGTSGRLLRGEAISYSGYTVKVIDFPAPVKSGYSGTPAESVQPFVGISISKNGIHINTTMLMQGDSFIVPDGELKVMAKLLPSKEATEWVYETYAPWVDIQFFLRGTPELEVSVETDYNEYTSSANTEISASVTISNTGSADAQNVNMEISTPLPLKRGILKYDYVSIKKGESITNRITFATPIITELNNYEILASATGYDARDIFYTSQSSKTIVIAPEPEQIPTIRKSVNAKIYLEEYAMVTLNFKNNANYEIKNVSITDTLPSGFKLLSNNSLQWLVNIPANGEWDARYLIKPEEVNRDGAVLPPANAEFRTNREYYSIQSDQPRLIVHGPKISLTKQIDVSSIHPGDTVIVKVSAENVGSTPTKVSITDQLPSEGTLISGATSLDDFLEATRVASFTYSLIINSEQPIKLPPASAEYNLLDAKSGKLIAFSNEPEIGIKSQESEQVEDVLNDSPSSEISEASAPAPTPEFPFTPIIEDEEPVLQETPSPEIKQVPVTHVEIQDILDMIFGCSNATTNESSIACGLIKPQ
jgi:uncharacterized repeat protein (TIGR01451 family)